MRWVIGGLVLIWTLLTVVAYAVVRPDRGQDEPVIVAMLEVADSARPGDPGAETLLKFRDFWRNRASGSGRPFNAVLADADSGERRELIEAFRAHWEAEHGPLSKVPTLVWSTDDNPARPVQCHLFRVWHMRTFGEPVNITTDPTNRDITKAIVQCVAGAGPDVIEAYGPGQLSQVVDAGFALDVTDVAKERGFDVSRVFDAAVPSIARDGRQYAFPCNVGYTVLFYHRDLFRRAGVSEPSGHWTLDDLVRTADALAAAGVVRKPFVFVNFSPWDITLSLGIDFLNQEGTGSEYNTPETVAALEKYLSIVYGSKVSPSPAEAASKATSGGANMNSGTPAAAAASAFFLNKDAAMVIDGRWQYVEMARRNFTVIREAAERRLREIDGGAAPSPANEAALLRSAITAVGAHVLNTIPDDQLAALEACLAPDDRARMLDIGVAHVPTLTGTPFYKAGARMAIANRASPYAKYAVRFLEFLASEPYNEQINQTFDSICGMPEFCFDDDGVSGPPLALPGLEGFDSPVFAEAMRDYAQPDRLSPFIGQARLGVLVGPFIEGIENNTMSPAEAAEGIEEAINEQVMANLLREPALRQEWERRTGATLDPARPLGEQIRGARAAAPARSTTKPAGLQGGAA